MVRSHALYPIELRAHPAELRFRIITETEWFRPSFPFPPNAARAGKMGSPAEKEDLPSKSFRRSAKPTRLGALTARAHKSLAMADNMLLLKADEVARNGAFGKILRPEVFPNAPCISLSPFSCRLKCTPLSFPALPPPK